MCMYMFVYLCASSGELSRGECAKLCATAMKPVEALPPALPGSAVIPCSLDAEVAAAVGHVALARVHSVLGSLFLQTMLAQHWYCRHMCALFVAVSKALDMAFQWVQGAVCGCQCGLHFFTQY